jgi:hypothetical protein
MAMKQSGAVRASLVLLAALGLAACSQAPEAGTVASAPTTAGTGSPAGMVALAGAGGEASRCSLVDSWTTAPDDGGLTYTPAPLSQVRAGRHACYDRVVFDVEGADPVGFFASYVPVVRADGSGEEVPVAGTAALEVVVRAAYLGSDDPTTWQEMPRTGDDLMATSELAQWNALRGVAFAGSFEGQTTFAVGVQGKRAFRVWTLASANGQRVILDIAH